jgi:hypothetical protein
MKNYANSLMMVLVVSMITASSIAAGTVYAKKATQDSSDVQKVETTPDNSQGIPRKLVDLQSQIDDLKQQIQSIQSPVLNVRVDKQVYHNGGNGQPPFPLRTATASCKSSETLIGGGYHFLPTPGMVVWINGPDGNNWVVQYISPYTGEETIYALCATLSHN